ncbi:unnamed protein product [Haemonchus placei]|uniref:TM2 domain-containing protein n=1 Tax=Haemonchus placei TaxID=6290 RepID=A0A0N4W0L1_HAEPC|nr:unnamed protein product [Haemonchus placei]
MNPLKSDESENKFFRILLMVGGVLGLHRLYLEQIPETFIFISTGGVFLLGVLYDSFFLGKQVEFYNMLKLGEGEEMKKYKNGKLMTNLSRMVSFSLPRFVASVAYGTTLGFLCWMAGSVTFGKSASDNKTDVSDLAFSGVYIIGNCDRECRDLVYIWIGSFSTTFIHVNHFFITDNCMRSLLFAAVVATWLGNRTARVRTSFHRPFTWKHLIFWTSLFGLLLGVIAVGATRHIFHRRVSFTICSYTCLLKCVEACVCVEFHFFSYIHFQERKWWDVDLVGRAPVWADMAAVFIVDLIHQEARVLRKRSRVEPLKWALWRMYLITREQSGPPSEQEKGARDFRFLGTAKACDIISK